MSLVQKAKAIKLVIFDVDGVLTSGNLTYSVNGIELKDFNVQDGQGIKLLQSTGVAVAIITAKSSPIIAKRMADLNINYFYQGDSNKLPAYLDLKSKLNLDDTEIAYVGDDLPDLPILRRVGLPITVPNATAIMQEYTQWVTQCWGGKGAVREVCDFIMQAQETYHTAIAPYLTD
jgi:3-deoxy-D-manno-octulosonate 8-phosphate phosphatase (KDO 8-P phosphatase)